MGKDATYITVSSDEAAVVDTPVRLTSVYDALAEDGPVIRLSVGYSQNATDKSYTAAAGSGDSAAGKGFSTSA